MSIDHKMQNFDALVPTLNLLSKQVGELNAVLQSLATKLDTQNPQDNDSQPKRFRVGK
jgi:hypothetical protein